MWNITSRREFRVYAYPAPKARLLVQHKLRPKVNSIADFLCFAPTEPGPSRQAFLKWVLDRFEAGNLGYTFAEKGVLQHCGWLAPHSTDSFFTEFGKQYPFPKKTSVLCDFYTHPEARGRGLFQTSIHQMLVDAARDSETEWIYISVLSDNGPSRHVIEKLGFEYVESVFS